MADVKWIKITTDIFDDEKILLIESLPDSYAIIVVWFKLLCLAGKQNNSGVFMMGQIAYTDKMLATIFRMKESTVTMALQTFEQFGMVEIIDGVITIPNWGKHQNLDQLESKKEYMRNYMKDYREKQKALTCKTSCKTNSKANVSEADKEGDKELESDLDIRDKGETPSTPKRKKATPFVPPTLEEIEAYCKERNNNVDAKRFFDYFSASDWVDSKGNKVKNWKQKVITWEGYANESKAGGRKEIVPTWMVNENRAKEDMERAKRLLADMEKPTVGNSPEVAAKAEDLKKSLEKKTHKGKKEWR